MPKPQPTSITLRGSVPPSNGSSAVDHGARGIDGLRVAAIVEVSIVGGRESLACGGPHDVPVQRLICNRNAQSSAPGGCGSVHCGPVTGAMDTTSPVTALNHFASYVPGPSVTVT